MIKLVKISAGIVTYNPDINRLSENINAINAQVDCIIIVDNGSENILNIEELLLYYKNIFLVKNRENLGIAKALNQIILLSKKNHYDWVITLDQDSVVADDIIRVFKKYISFENIAIITPLIVDRNIQISEDITKPYEYVEKCITSGSLTKIQACENVGYFDEKMFIDIVDFEFCARLQEKGYKILKVNETKLLHELGKSREVYFLGKKIIVYNHSPIRKYYYTRNFLYYIRKHKNLLDIKKIYFHFIYRLIVTIMFEEKKMEKFKQIVGGFKDSKKMMEN